MKLKSAAGTSSGSVTNNAVSPSKTQHVIAAPQSTTVIQVSKALPEIVVFLSIGVSLLFQAECVVFLSITYTVPKE